ncbi:MAG: CYTH domain-containing protein [Candidatus Helarchaeota archaeon]
MSFLKEYEIMIPIPNIEEVNKVFKEIGATRTKKVFQIDEYYDFLPLRLSKKDELLRIRSEFRDAKSEFIEGEFSWKSERRGTDEGYEVRDDISIKISNSKNLEQLRNIINKLGIRLLAKIEKYRDRWKLENKFHLIEFEFDKNIFVTGQNLPRKEIGSYLQATIETYEDISDDKIKELLWNILKTKFNFTIDNFEPRTYIEIYLNVKKPLNL